MQNLNMVMGLKFKIYYSNNLLKNQLTLYITPVI